MAAAWYLQRAAEESGRPLSYTVLEGSSRWGGKIVTDAVSIGGKEPFTVEGGPDSFLTQKPWALELARELGLREHLLPTNDEQRKVYVLNRGRLTPLPEGMFLIVPTRFLPFALSPLISLPGKVRMALDLFIPPREGETDETLSDFVTRRLGAEARDKIAEPLMSGIYNSQADRQSLLATFPRFREMEKQHGSLIKAMLAARRARQKRSDAQKGAGNRPTSVFLSFKEGMELLVDTLVARLEGDLRLQTVVRALTAEGRGYRLHLEDGATLAADAVILAVPAFVAARLIDALAPEAGRRLDQIRYVSTGTISLGFNAAEVAHRLDGFGVVIPPGEQRSINALTWTSTKFDERAPEGAVLLRAFFGGSRTPEMMDLDDETLVSVVRHELRELLGITARPLFHRIYRWYDANPQYDLNHLQHVAAIEQALPPGLYVTGSPYRGIGIPDCVRQARETVGVVMDECVPANPALEPLP